MKRLLLILMAIISLSLIACGNNFESQGVISVHTLTGANRDRDSLVWNSHWLPGQADGFGFSATTAQFFANPADLDFDINGDWAERSIEHGGYMPPSYSTFLETLEDPHVGALVFNVVRPTAATNFDVTLRRYRGNLQLVWDISELNMTQGALEQTMIVLVDMRPTMNQNRFRIGLGDGSNIVVRTGEHIQGFLRSAI